MCTVHTNKLTKTVHISLPVANKDPDFKFFLKGTGGYQGPHVGQTQSYLGKNLLKLKWKMLR